MLFSILSINWTGQAVTSEQLLVLRNVAATHLRKGRKNAVINFSHELCEGHITRGKEGTLGTVKGEPWTVDFMLPRGSEKFVLTDDSIVISTRPLATGGISTEQVNHHVASTDNNPSIH